MKIIKRIGKLERQAKRANVPSGLAAFYHDIKQTEALFYPEVK